MKVYYALYDQSYENNAQYWTWFPDEITQRMRDAIASKAGAFQMRPKRPNMLETSDIVGGIINYQDQWSVVYRFFNGGNDPQGRPDRCVLATAWVKAEETQGQNLYDLLFCPVFQNIQQDALVHCPVPAPDNLIEDCFKPIQQDDPQFEIFKADPNIENWTFDNPEEVEVIGKLFPLLAEQGLQSLQILQSAAYMETFSGTPLASGITYNPQLVKPKEEQKEDLTVNPHSKTKTYPQTKPLSKTKSHSKPRGLFKIVFQLLFNLILLGAIVYAFSYSSTCQKLFIKFRDYIQKQINGRQSQNVTPDPNLENPIDSEQEEPTTPEQEPTTPELEPTNLEQEPANPENSNYIPTDDNSDQ